MKTNLPVQNGNFSGGHTDCSIRMEEVSTSTQHVSFITDEHIMAILYINTVNMLNIGPEHLNSVS